MEAVEQSDTSSPDAMNAISPIAISTMERAEVPPCFSGLSIPLTDQPPSPDFCEDILDHNDGLTIPPTSGSDAVSPLTAPFCRQYSALSTSPSLDPQSSLTSGPSSRTPSQMQSNSQLHSVNSNSIQPPVVNPLETVNPLSGLRSYSVGSSLAQRQHMIHPGASNITGSFQPPLPRPSTTVTPLSNFMKAESYQRCASVHSAPGDARYRIHSVKQTGPPKSRLLSKLGLLSLFGRRSHASIRSKEQQNHHLQQQHQVQQQESRTEATPQVGRSSSSSSNHTPISPIAKAEGYVPSAAITSESATRPSRGALEMLNHLMIRKSRDNNRIEATDEVSGTNYFSGSIGLLLRKPRLFNTRRKRNAMKHRGLSTTEGLESQYTHSKTTVAAGQQPDVPDAEGSVSGVCMNGDSTPHTSPTNRTRGKKSRNLAETISPGSDGDRQRELASQEVALVYQQLIEEAEGDRLGATVAEAWRDINAVSEQSTPLARSHDPNPEDNSTDDYLSRPQRPDYNQLPTVVLDTNTSCSHGAGRTNGGRWFRPNLPPIRTYQDKTNSDSSSIDSPTNLQPHNIRPDAHTSLETIRDPDACIHSETTEVPEIPEDSVPYVMVAKMIDILSQRIMNQITEEELEDRLRALDQTMDTNGGSVSVTVGVDPTMPTEPSSEMDRTGVERNRRRWLKHSLLAQARRLENQNKLEIGIDLLDRLVAHTTYPPFEADMLQLLGRQPNWHHISILYYLARCAVRHLLRAHFSKLDSLSLLSCEEEKEEEVASADVVRDIVEAQVLKPVGPLLERTGSGVGSVASLNASPLTKLPESARLAAIDEMGHCRASVERIKDFTVTFFHRWYMGWVDTRGGWQSVIEETDESELD